MSTIVKEFNERIENEKVTGTANWIRNKDWEERRVLIEHLKKIDGAKYEAFSSIQKTIFCILQYNFKHVMDLTDMDLDLQALSEIEIEELIDLFGLEKPNEKYKEIKRRIASPTSFFTGISYPVLMELYKRGKVPYDREIFTACLIRFNVWHATRFVKEFSEETHQKLLRFFPQDEFTLDVLLGVFEMELGVDGAFYLEREYNIGAIIISLVKEGKYSKEQVQQKIFEAFNNPTLKQTTHGWAKNVYKALKLSKEENIKCQDQLIELLSNDRTLILNFAVQQLQKIASDTQFNWENLINSLDAVVYRKKINGALKKMLAMLFKQFKKDSTLLEQACVNLAPIFLQEENAVQMEAVKCYQLLDGANSEVSEALSPFVGTMHSEAKSGLGFLLSEEEVSAMELPYETYQQAEYIPPACTPENQLAYIDNENDFIFLCTKVLKSQDGLDYELFLEGLIRFHSIKDTHKKALQPALKNARKVANQYYLDITARKGIHHIMAAKLICIWLDPEQKSITEEIAYWEGEKKAKDKYVYTPNRWLAFYYLFKRLSQIEKIIKDNKALSLLSIPTQTDGSIHPKQFFERLAEYELADEPIDEADFNLALTRINRWTKFNEKSTHQSEYRDIINYLLDDKKPFAKGKMKSLDRIWHTAFLLKNPSMSMDSLVAFHNEKEWWMLNKDWEWVVDRQYSEDPNYNYSWPRIDLKLQLKDAASNNFVHSHFEYYLVDKVFVIADVSHWFYRDIYQREPLYLSFILKCYRYLSDIEASEGKSIMGAIIEASKNPAPLGEIGHLFLCLSLYCGKTSIRNASFDWLSLLIKNRYLNLELFAEITAKLIANEHHVIPMKRVSEQFDQLLQMGGGYIDILYQALVATLSKINSENLPKSFKNILHYYYEALQKTQLPITESIQANLEKMKKVNSVKKEVKKILEFQPK